ncbi:MAG: SurA N-terminal domain-containing protein [Coxiellaceae bacterium]|nr:MAG: SurA N-terminal domain-containing protein [Coxiellaceae bacterium]
MVNNEVITQTQLNEQTTALKQQLQATNAPALPDAKLRQQALDDLIDKTLILQLAKRNKVQVSSEQVNNALNNIASNNKMTLAQLKEALTQQGMNYEAYRKQIQEQLLISTVQQRAVAANINVTEKEVDQYLSTHKDPPSELYLQDLLVPVADNADATQIAAAQKRADELLKQVQKNKNANLADFAKDGVENIDLGWRTVPEIPSIFTQQAANMKAGDVAGPIKAGNGFHIIKLVDARSNGPKLSKSMARQMIYQQKLRLNTQPWIQQLRETAYIKIVPAR